MSLQYLLQVLCILTIIAVPVSLSKKSIKRSVRILIAMLPVVAGILYFLLLHENSGIFLALIGLWAQFFIFVHPKKQDD